MRSRQLLPLGLSLASAFLFALALQSAWWVVANVDVGPFGSRACFSGECTDRELAWLKGTELWMRSATAAKAGGYIAMFIFIMIAAGLASRRIPRLLAKAALVAIITASVAGGYFALGFPGVGSEPTSLGRGLFLFPLAIALGVAAAVTTLRVPERRA